jgi:DNA-binding beta-propeller fold protein YncE
VKTDPGQIVFLDAATLAVVGRVPVGALPDMVTYTSDGAYLLVANEAEPNDLYTIDPEGSVSIIDLRNGLAAATMATAGFHAYIGQEAALRAAGVRIYGNYTVGGAAVGSNAAQDFEPEYITVAGPRAYVTLQENNALAVIDIGSAQVLSVTSFGSKNHNRTVNGVAVNGLDVNQSDSSFDLANDNDLAVFGNANVNGINIAPWPVFGMYQPDGIATLRLPGGEIFLVTANEGDEREWAGLTERTTVSAVDLDNGIFPNETLLKTNEQLGRLRITNQLGKRDAGNTDDDYEALYVPGARSFSIWTPRGGASGAQLELVWDSADQFESITAQRLPLWFNSDHEVNTRDARSRSKGPEPEGVTIGRYGMNQYAFVTLERIGGVMVYDVTNPLRPTFVDYVNPRNFAVIPTSGATDSGPEGVVFVSEESSPNGKPLLLVGNEVSQTLTVYEITKKKVQ